MQYKVEHNGTSCILPAFTRNIKKKVDEVNTRLSNTDIALDDRVNSLHEFLTDTVGEETLTKVLGSADMDEIDLNDMNILYLKIAKEYDRPVADYNKPEFDANTKKILQDIAGAAKSVESIQRVANMKR